MENLTNYDLVKRLGLIDRRLKEINIERHNLKMEYNDIMLELWQRVPEIQEEKVKKRDK